MYKTIHVETAGTLPALIAESDKYEITELTVTGNLDNADMGYIKDMADDKLSVLDLSGAEIVNNTIATSAFYDCRTITRVKIPNSIISIGQNAFGRCDSLTSLTIPGGVTEIGKGAMEHCTDLMEIIVLEENEHYSAINGVLFDKKKNTLIRYPQAKTDTSYSIPDSVTSVEESAFDGCENLMHITIPNSVIHIEKSAFSDCNSLTHISIPDNVTSIEIETFSGCNDLTQVIIPDSVTHIEEKAFSFCSSLIHITIPKNVSMIELGAFGFCERLEGYFVSEENAYYSAIDGVLFNKEKTALIHYPIAKPGVSYIIPDSVTNIDKFVFVHCSILAHLTIPESVTFVDPIAFLRCESIMEFIVSEKNAHYSTIDGVLFDKEKTTFVRYPRAKPDASYIIPDSVTSIGEYAFEGCLNLKRIAIPNSVTEIRKGAFDSCRNLSAITIPESVSLMSIFAFWYCANLKEIHNKNPVPQVVEKWGHRLNTRTCRLYVPKGSYDAYRNAEGWGKFTEIIEE